MQLYFAESQHIWHTAWNLPPVHTTVFIHESTTRCTPPKILTTNEAVEKCQEICIFEIYENQPGSHVTWSWQMNKWGIALSCWLNCWMSCWLNCWHLHQCHLQPQKNCCGLGMALSGSRQTDIKKDLLSKRSAHLSRSQWNDSLNFDLWEGSSCQ